ncbi:GARP complex component (Vps54), putative [Talaromyces stipitatus ATCC 10500]|uniref:Vacuolar protein sorting-associated protein 54 n=1 Tax=Talaromyces stipitatus (strain ATCC 10500 / CBS 375.48 / QM 6759 / NRRL 1006) TaxID=441959 RepID=B8MAS8_TALSN|nr:GARP complex component (Vps54), putative [Talaromyces stipitatus ATCC 10500]EED17768.1 GARP complex component (Vps54), putative [Talaromyces stipitatus ATCC 10500]
MTSSPRKSIDSLASVTSIPSLQQFSQNTYDSPRIAPAQRLPQRRSSTASSLVSIGGILDSSTHRSSIAELAISALLQPPIVRTGLVAHTSIPATGYKPPTARDIPPVTLTNISNVESKAFQPYLEQVGSLYDAFQRAKEGSGNEENDSHLVRNDATLFPSSALSPRIDEYDGRRTPILERRLSGVSTSSRAHSPFDMRGMRRSSYGKGAQAVTPLSTIPNVYFEEDFHLENPRTFDVVSEKSEVVRQPSKASDQAGNGAAVEPPATRRKALATNAILQEKLSWYMDTVEIHLISSISTASKSFFTALGSLRELHAEAADSVRRIQILRKDLNKIDKEMAMGGLKVVKLRQRRQNIRKLADAMSQLHEVVEAVTECENIIDQGEVEDAIDGLDEVGLLLAGEQATRRRNQDAAEQRPPVDLRGLHALQGIDEELARLRQRIGVRYESRFVDDLLTDLRRHISSVPGDVTLQRWGASFQRNRGGHRAPPSISPAYIAFDGELRSKLHAELVGLGRSHYTMPAATSFKTAVLREMKALIRKHLPSSSDDDNESVMSASTHGGRQLSSQEKSSILARNLRALDADSAYDMLKQIYTGVSESLRRLGVQVKVLLDITSGLGAQPSPAIARSATRSPDPQNIKQTPRSHGSAAEVAAVQEEILQVLDMSSLLGQAVDIVQSQIVKVLKVRSEQTSHLPIEDFLRYFSLNRLFADECEAISGRSGTSLKTVVDNQIRDFIVRFSDNQRHKIVQVMDADKWDARDFGDVENAVLERILRASTTDVDLWLHVSRIWQPAEAESPATNPNAENGTGVNGSAKEKEKLRHASFDEQRYVLPESAVTIMKSIEEFEYLMANLPSMTQDIGSNLVECLKLFNSRSSQLILGAGATRSAGLKNINTKHLALSSQALSFIIALIPYVREFARRQSPSSQLMGEFDKVKRLCQEHQNGIHEKLVDIMGGRSASHVNSMKKIDWDAEKDLKAVSGYMETLTKETATLHRVLVRHFPEMTVMMIMEPVFKSYREQWKKAFQEVNLKTESGRQRMLSDVEYFKSKMGKIDGSGDLGDTLIQVVNAKTILPENIAEPSPQTETSSPSNEASSSPPVPEKDDKKADSKS